MDWTFSLGALTLVAVFFVAFVAVFSIAFLAYRGFRRKRGPVFTSSEPTRDTTPEYRFELEDVNRKDPPSTL